MRRSRTRSPAIVALAAALLTTATMAPRVGAQEASPEPAGLSDRMARIVGHPSLQGAVVGLVVRDVDGGEVLVDFNGDDLFAPASVNKLFTAAAALWRLGPSFVWQTPIAFRGLRDDGGRGPTIEGDLWVLGRGAPDTVEEQLWIAARAVQAQGIERVTGDIVVDDRYFDDVRYGEAWPGGVQTREAYHAPVSALMANYSAAREGDEWVAVDDPTIYFGERLAELLALAGVAVDGGVRVPTAAETVEVPEPLDVDPANSRRGLPDGLRLLYAIHSEPLGRLVFDLNKFSNNVMAESILKTLGAVEYGAPGTTSKGIAAVSRFRSEVLGASLTDYVHTDGSGLSRTNRLSPRQVVDLLHYAYSDFHLGPELVASLKISGRDGFNPRPFRDPPLLGEMRLKSGHIRGVNTLSGYAHSASGRVLAFCILINGHRAQQWEIDQRVAELSQVILSSY